MLITKEIDYAVRVLRRLQDGELTATPQICRDEDLPLHFVYRILKKLDNAGIVDIARGKDGGARLTCDLGALSMYDLIEALGERRYVSACTKPGYECTYRRGHGGKCSVHDNLGIFQNDLDDLLKSKTISQVIGAD
jgi:Rrf2 family protein